MKHLWKLLLALIAGVVVLIGLTSPPKKSDPAAAGSAAAPAPAAVPAPATTPTPAPAKVVASTPAPSPASAPAAVQASVPAAAPAAAAPIQTRKTLNQKTQTVLVLADALKDGGVRAEMSITSQGIGIAADAYRTSVGKGAMIAVTQRMQHFQALHDRKPRDHKEFMDEIIAPGKPDELQLPMLPYYQEYAYDPESQELVVIDFPAKKEQRQKETTGAAGL
jgi:hypothetical protein